MFNSQRRRRAKFPIVKEEEKKLIMNKTERAKFPNIEERRNSIWAK